MAEKDLNQLNEERNKLIVRTSIIGILANVLLAGFKMVVGLFAHSIAIILDAVNNLSDVLSSLVTIVGNKLAIWPAARPAGRSSPPPACRRPWISAPRRI